MNRPADTMRAWLRLMRLSNLPTVWTNALVGAAIALPVVVAIPWLDMLIATLAISLFYIAGMALNDLVDARADAAPRSDRPIPSGQVSRCAAGVFAVITFTVGCVLLWVTAPYVWPAALALIAAIVLYDLSHKRWAGAIILMGACRSLVYLVVAWTVAGDAMNLDVWILAILIAAAMGLYIIGLSWIARVETKQRMDFRRFPATVMMLALFSVFALMHPSDAIWSISAGIILMVWLIRAFRKLHQHPPRTQQAVLTLLSGICLVDAFFITVLGQPSWSLAAVVCFIITVLGHRRVSGT